MDEQNLTGTNEELGTGKTYHSIPIPRGMYRRGKTWWITKRLGSETLRLSTKCKSLPKAIEFYKKWDQESEQLVINANLAKARVRVSQEWSGFLTNEAQHWVEVIHKRYEARAKDKGLEFQLTQDIIRSLIVNSGGACSLTGIKLEWLSKEGTGGKGHNPYRAVIDRIDPSKGYTAENCRIICHAVNVALFVWGEPVLEKVALGYLLKKHIKDAT